MLLLSLLVSLLWARVIPYWRAFQSWLKHYATSRKVEGSSPDVVIGFFFNLPKPSGGTMSLGSTQPLTEMRARNLPVGKGGPALQTDNLPPFCESIV
jgi:hypothetical protein